VATGALAVVGQWPQHGALSSAANRRQQKDHPPRLGTAEVRRLLLVRNHQASAGGYVLADFAPSSFEEFLAQVLAPELRAKVFGMLEEGLGNYQKSTCNTTPVGNKKSHTNHAKHV